MTTKKFVKGSVLWTVAFLTVMALVAILVPKEHEMVILVVEIVLALVWTIVNTLRILLLIRKQEHSDSQSAEENE